MRWQRGQRSEHIEDRRRSRAGMKLGIGGTIVVLLLAAVFGEQFLALLGQTSGSSGSSEPVPRGEDPDAELVDFVSFVIDDIQATWKVEFERMGRRYRPAKLVLFTGKVDSACGFASAAVGPFYCPSDHNAYIDLSFYRDLRERFGAPGDFAQAYVIAHEIGHHVQNLLGFSERVRREERAEPRRKNELSIRLELQADCLAGVWGHSTKRRDILDKGDVEEGLAAAAAIGDDRLQEQARGRVAPETWTHGSSAQRARWLRRGIDSGTVEACDTFSALEP